MTSSIAPDFARHWRDIVVAFLRLGATGYGGPAIMGLMQADLQARRRWVSSERFVEGLSLVNALPGATRVQLSIFLGYARGGWWGGTARRTLLRAAGTLRHAGPHDRSATPAWA
jgi:chromate transport protein ChrA